MIRQLILLIFLSSCASNAHLQTKENIYEVKVIGGGIGEFIKIKKMHVITKNNNIITLSNIQDTVTYLSGSNLREVCIETHDLDYYPKCFTMEEIASKKYQIMIPVGVHISSTINFKPNSLELNSKKEIEEIKDIIYDLTPERYMVLQIRYKNNGKLNQKRAKIVRQLFIDLGFPKQRVQISKDFLADEPYIFEDSFWIDYNLDTTHCKPCTWPDWAS
ncbi:MAG: hypothetical protein JJT94_01870 [Bernardetiaceae bacterium]|nr:hypothetical protein [Bernardetiaceae bacterium]